MRRLWCAIAIALLAGCGVAPSGVADGGRAPTGVAPGVTLYFVDANGDLRPQVRPTGHLGTISEAVSLLLAGVGGSDLRTEITANDETLVLVNVTSAVIELRMQLGVRDVTPLGTDQIVCTALGVHVQSGGSKSTRVRILFAQPSAGSDALRSCPLIR